MVAVTYSLPKVISSPSLGIDLLSLPSTPHEKGKKPIPVATLSGAVLLAILLIVATVGGSLPQQQTWPPR